MIADEFGGFDLHKIHTFYQFVGDPLESFSLLERFFFARKAFYFRPAERPTRSLSFTMPIYTFWDKRIANAFLVTIELSGISKDDIKILDVKKNAF